MASFKALGGDGIPAALRPLAAEEAEAAKAGGGNLEEIYQSTSTERADSESLAKGVAVSESHYQSDEGKTIPLAWQRSKNTFAGDQEALSQSSEFTTNQNNHASNLHACDQCDKAFQRASELARHKWTHSGRKASRRSQRWSQKHSAMSISQRSGLMINHAKNLHACDHGGIGLHWPSQPAQHHKNVHCENEATKQDQKELEVFRPSLLHQKLQSRRTKLPHICNQCGKDFQWPSDLARHERVHSRRNAARQNLCNLETCCPGPVVPVLLQAKNTFANSYKTSSKDSDSVSCTKNHHVCDQCGKAFQWRSSLARHHQYEHFRGKAVRQKQGLSEACKLRSLAPFLSEVENTVVDSHETLTQTAVLTTDRSTNIRKSCISNQCGKTFQFLSDQAQQKLTHTRGKLMRGKCTQFKKPYICDQCGKKFKCPSDLARHEQTHTRRKQQKSHLCEQCGQSFTCVSDFIQHLSTHSSERPYGCAICGFRFRRHVQLEQHQKWHDESHETEEAEEDQKHWGARGQDLSGESIPARQLQCPDLQSSKDEKSFASPKSCECGECYTTASNSLGMPLPNSILEIGVSGVPHILPLVQTCECGYCGINGGNSDMKSPELPHLKAGITASAVSTKSTVLSNSSEDHKSMAYMQRKKASTRSSPTHARWLHAVAGQSHKRSCSPRDPIWFPEQASTLAGKEKTFSCPICPKQFSLPSYLMKHLGIHQPGKPYQCTTCKKCFAQRSYLLKHRKVHSVNLAHECPDCGKRFTQIPYLRKHMQIHTK